MFQKPTFGSTSAGFGSFNTSATTSSPFGGFKPATGPAFGAVAQPAQNTGFFGAPNTNTSGLFGAAAPASTASTFGASTSAGFGFGAANTSGGLFGSTNTSGGLFGANQQQNTSAFGAKPAGFGFGAAPTASPFGSTPAPAATFGTSAAGGSLFGAGSSFGQQQVTGTAHAKYNPVVGTDVMVKSGTTQNINIKHHCITCMKEYENKSLEELRLEDYQAGRKGGGGAGSMFSNTKPMFGGSTFGQPATTTAPSVFGGTPALGTTAFGQSTLGQNNTFAFGGNTQNTNTTSSLFGANKPAFGATPAPGTSLFGATSTPAPAFGTNTSTFGFGSNTQTQQQSTGLFGAKPATTGFGAPAPAFGGFGGGLFGGKATTTPAFGSTSTTFGTNTSTTGLFGNNTFKPATTPAFGFGPTQPTTGLGLGGGLGSTAFQAKPSGTGFPSLNTTGSTLFSGLPQPTMNFNTGNTTLGGGLGTGLGFGNTSTLGGSSLGQLGGNTGMLGSSLTGASVAGNVHEQILTLAARPYGDSTLYKDVVPDSGLCKEDVLKPTNPAAVKAVLANAEYKVSSTDSARLKITPRAVICSQDKKSLFDGLEESDPSLEYKLSLKPSRKRLILKPKPDRISGQTDGNRSLEEKENLNKSQDNQHNGSIENRGTIRKSVDFADNIRGINTDLEENSEKHNSWLGSSKLSWNDSRERPVDSQPTPRLYPDLDKEVPQMPERRASWLTTKPLRKKSLQDHDPQDSVRELRTEFQLVHDKENIEHHPGEDDHLSSQHSNSAKLTNSVSEIDNPAPIDAPPHPTGVKLTRPGYYTVPSLDDMISYIRPDGRCVVPHLTIGRKNYGNVYYDCEIDVTGLDLDSLVYLVNKEVIVYPEDSARPPVGSGLNRRAIVTLDRVWPIDKTEKRPITDPNRLMKMDYEGKLRRVCDKHDTKFIEYRPQTGSWVFRVDHFSKYGLTDSDEEDDFTPEVLKRQLVNQSLQKNAAPAAQVPLSSALTTVGLGGLPTIDENIFAMQQTSLNLGNGRTFEMDTTEDIGEIHSMYPEVGNRAFDVKSPTSELARLENRQSHNLQLMKASFYNDMDMDEDNMSVSTGDQLVPQPKSVLVSAVNISVPIIEEDEIMPIQSVVCEDIPLRPLNVIPHTIVLKYHSKIPPLKKTIAGRLDANCIADMSICRARHSRVGFTARLNMAFVTSSNTISQCSNVSELCDLDRYVQGRGEDDWSEQAVVRLAIAHTDKQFKIQDVLQGHLEALLDLSSSTQEVKPEYVPKLQVNDSPTDRRELLKRHLKYAEESCRRDCKFGVSGAYFLEIWKLCEALWGAILDNDGVESREEDAIVNEHRALIEWMVAALCDVTDKQLAEPQRADSVDETDSHSGRVWTLLLGGRIIEACKLARQNGDLNMAALIAQASGDTTVRSLISRQLSTWRSCGADSLISGRKLATLGLIAGQVEPKMFTEEHWLQTLHACSRYICPQIPTLEQIVLQYESMFSENQDEDLDLTRMDTEACLQYPEPDYRVEYDVCVINNGSKRRVLDLRYELIRARALNSRPKLHPASYTPDPLDYSLSFLLGTWLGNPTTDSITGISDQLESVGAWHLAALTLCYLDDDKARNHLIKGVISRNVPIQDSHEYTQQMKILKRLNVPVKWVYEARAYRARYQHEHKLELENLVAAELWNEAHRVLLDELLPTTVLADDVDSISHLLEKMNEAAENSLIHGWEYGGQALYHYQRVCAEIRTVVSSAENDKMSVSTRLESLRPILTAAATALSYWKPKSTRSLAAKAEMGTRLIQAAMAKCESAGPLSALLKCLDVPPSCHSQAHEKIITDLAEQASESCISIPIPSPISSCRRSKMELTQR